MLPGHVASRMTVLERQRAHLRWQGPHGDFGSHEVPDQPVKLDSGPGNGWPELGSPDIPGEGCANLNLAGRQGSLKKRKFDKMHTTKVDDENKDKKTRGFPMEDEESKITQQSNNISKGNCSKRETSACSSKETSKASEIQKTDYIHVRARRGQATDSHSLAERARREKISERMKYLQNLVPGCNKITGKAGMLDEIINYVQSLQRQIEFLSMKLAAVNPMIDLNIDNLFAKEAFPICTASILNIDMSPEINSHINYLQANPMHQAVSCLGLELGINTSAGHQASITAPLPIPETFLDSTIFNQILPSSTWESDLQNLYSVDFFQQGRATSLASQQYTGSVEVSNLKMEM
ncbi:hypothetical protein CRG98_010386 [Punica granatum]|uniref:BHLH domain-containing protein n=2 Tax=Punica granatum TaxID=22663 RepID=A0A2I0KLB6_PUNGR|nr:hypothetical protein CRG98_010386 [Punica granatum]